MNQLLERYLGVLKVEDTTRNGYERLIRLQSARCSVASLFAALLTGIPSVDDRYG